jgi:uncharacterized protein
MSANARLIEHVNDLRRRPGNRREVHRTLVAEGLAISASGVPEGAEVGIDGVLESIAGGIVFDGTVTMPWMGECRRCLNDIEGTITTEVREVFETTPTEGETWQLAGDELDLAPMARDTVLLALPLAPLCSPDCLGPAPEVFPAVVAAEEPALDGASEPGDAAPRDPRWAALDQLRSD